MIEYMSIIETTEDMAGKWRARIMIKDLGIQTLKFDHDPTTSEVEEAAERFCVHNDTDGFQGIDSDQLSRQIV